VVRRTWKKKKGKGEGEGEEAEGEGEEAKGGGEEAGGDEGDGKMHVEDVDEVVDDEGTTGANAVYTSECKGMVVVQRCTVKQLITGNVRRCAAEARLHSRARLDSRTRKHSKANVLPYVRAC
jgi:hypothetical protein